MGLVDTCAAVIQEHGETMTLARTGETSISLKGKRLSGALYDAGNSATQQHFRVLIAPTELAASGWSSKVPSADTDLLTVGGRRRRILDVQPRSDGDTVAMYELTVAG